MRFLQVSNVKCSTGKGSYYRRVKLFRLLFILLTWSEEVLSTETAVTATE